MPKLLGKFVKSVLSCIYPPICLHCDSICANSGQFICTDCSAELLNFVEKPSSRIENNSHFTHLSPLFVCEGQAETLYREYYKRGRFALSKGISALFCERLLIYDWPMPDQIVPIPTHFTERLSLHYDPNLYVAKELSKVLNKPCINGLKCVIKLENDTVCYNYEEAIPGFCEGMSPLFIGGKMPYEKRLQKFLRFSDSLGAKHIQSLFFCH